MGKTKMINSADLIMLSSTAKIVDLENKINN